MNLNSTEIVGYMASIILMISFLMKDLRHLRMINSVACGLFVAYGFMLNTAWPIILSNGFIMGVNGWYLLRSSKKE